jgi:hypothetical protein
MTFPGPDAQPCQDHGQQLSGKRRRSCKGWLIASMFLNAIPLITTISSASQHSGPRSSKAAGVRPWLRGMATPITGPNNMVTASSRATGATWALPMLSAERTPSRMKTAAAWLFVLPVFAEGVLPGVVKLEVAGLAVLAFMTLVRGLLPPRGLERVFAVAAVLSLVVIGYLAFGSWPAAAGAAREYDLHAVLFVVTYATVAVFAALLFDAEIFARVMWRAATIALWAAVLSCLFSRLTGHVLLVNANDGGLRMTGTMPEPSAWAPVLALVLLLALRRRSWLYVLLAVTGLWLADSPTCVLVMAVSLPLYAALCSRWRHRMALLAALAVVIPAAAVFVLHASPQGYLDSSNPAEVAAGRLISGIRDVETGGQEGTNTRFANTAGVVDVARDNGWLHAGAGPAADVTYFAVMYPPSAGQPVAVNALWASVLFDFGEGGLAVLALLLVIAAWRMRRYPELAAILLPMCVASLVNSSIPDWSFAALAVMLFAVGWVRHPARRRMMTPGPPFAPLRPLP